MIGCVLVLLMQAGFLLLEIGFSRQKNVGAGVAKILVNLAVDVSSRNAAARAEVTGRDAPLRAHVRGPRER